MKIVLTINGRQALPVRAIPFATCYEMSPDKLAACAALPANDERKVQGGSHAVRNPQHLPTFALSGDGSFRPMDSIEWEAVAVRVDCLSKALRADERTENENWAKWRDDSIQLLPHSAFVWFDDFETWRQRNSYITLSKELEGLPFDELVDLASTPESTICVNAMVPLVTDPLVPRELASLVIEGFETTLTESDSEDTDSSDQQNKLIGPFVTKQELIDGLHLHESKWDEILKKPHSAGKRYLSALVSKGLRGRAPAGKTNSSLWNPIEFTRLAVERGDLNQGQAVARFRKAWPQWQDEFVSEMG